MMNPLAPHFLPIPYFVQPDLPTTRRRYRSSQSPIPEATRERIRSRHAAGRSLRALATEFRVSHETIRTIVHEGDTCDALSNRRPVPLPSAAELGLVSES